MPLSKFKQAIGWMNSTTERTLVFWSIGFWIIALIVMGLTFLSLGQNQLLNEARQRNIEMASITSRDVSAEIGSILESARTFNQHLQQLSPDLVTQATAIVGLRLSSPHYRAIYYFDADGSSLLHVTESLASLVALRSVDNIVTRPPIALKAEITDAFKAVGGASTFISDVYTSPVDYSGILYIAMPVSFASLGTRVTVFEIDLSDIWQTIEIGRAHV